MEEGREKRNEEGAQCTRRRIDNKENDWGTKRIFQKIGHKRIFLRYRKTVFRNLLMQ
jgi:hypothetical protein